MKYQSNGQPGWVKEFSAKFTQGISHAFLLHFNVTDYVLPGVSLRDYIARTMASREIVVFYNRAEGFVFPLESHKTRFMEILGLNTPQGLADAKMAGLTDPVGPSRNDPRVCLGMITKLLRMGKPENKLACVVIEYAESLFPEGAGGGEDRTNLVLAQSWGRDPQVMASGNLVFMIAEEIEGVARPLRQASSRWEEISIPLPDKQARLDYIAWYMENARDFETDLTDTQIANATAFLQLVHIEDIFLRASEEGTLTLEQIKERKAEIISGEFSDVLEIWEPVSGFEAIGGLELMKDFFRKNLINPLATGNVNRIPKGVLMMGPAGTGKSVMAEAIAKEAKVNSGQLNLSKIFDKFVGSTERNLEKIVRAMISLAPFICLIDEIDQSVSRGEQGDSGVSNRVFKRLLEIMADESLRGKVIFLTATNRPDLMDAALKRPGRLDKKVAFFVPNRTEREAILNVMISRYIAENHDQNLGDYVLDQTEGWTGAELVEVARKAAEIMDDSHEDISLSDSLSQAVDRLCPTTQNIQDMTALAMAEINDLDLVPPEYREQWKAIRKAPRPTITQSVSTETGRQRRDL